VPTAKLRQDIVRTLPYAGDADREEQCIYWDEALPCFGLRVRPAGRQRAGGRRNFVCSYRIHGRKRLASLGRADVITLDQARKKARTFLGQVAKGEDPKAPDDAYKVAMTVNELSDLYLTRHARAKKKSWKDDERYLNNHLVPKLGSRLALTITSEHISEIHSEIGQNHPYAANRFLEIVSKVFNCARTWKKVPKQFENPAEGIEEFPEFKRKIFVTTEQFPRLAQAIEVERSEYARHALWLLLLIGIRLKELLKSKWSDIDWDQRTLYIGQTKNGEPVLAPLSLAAIERLRLVPRLEENPFIICGKLHRQHLKNLRSAWVRVRKEAGLFGVRMHDLRRTVGSWLVQSGESLHLVGAVLNHKDPKTTAGYAYFQTQHRQAALDRHGAKLTGLSTQSQNAVGPITGTISKQVAQAAASTRGVHRFTREKLHELVWSEPVSTLAAKYGISDVGLSKACRRAGIPLPPRGYWAKVAAGQSAQKPVSLAPARPGMSVDVAIRTRAKIRPPKPGSHAAA
jgi:integrase